MPWITEKDSSYWFPEQLPEKTEEYNTIQENKRYLNKEKQIRTHPRWNYDNGALVCDDYLFYNEGWKVILSTPMPELSETSFKRTVENPIEEWEEIDEKSIKITFTIRDFTDEEINEHKVNKFGMLRAKRNNLLVMSDHVLFISYEKNLTVSDEFKSYRQKLRDFPETVDDILNFDIKDDSLWPALPNTNFVEA